MRPLSMLVASAVLVLSTPVAAHSGTTGIVDPAGDGENGRKLDVTSATMKNNANAIRIRVEVVKVSKGDLIVFLKLKGHKRFALLSEYDPREGTVTNTLSGGTHPSLCTRITATWSTSDDFISVRIPATCLDGGDYDEAKFKLLTEVRAADTDLAPTTAAGTKWRWSPFVARG